MRRWIVQLLRLKATTMTPADPMTTIKANDNGSGPAQQQASARKKSIGILTHFKRYMAPKCKCDFGEGRHQPEVDGDVCIHN